LTGSRSTEPRSLERYDRIPPQLAKTLYSESLELAEKGLGSCVIAKELSIAHSLRICPMTVSHWISGNRKPRLRNIFTEEPSPALSYIIGANIGDGCKMAKSGCVKLEVSDLDFAEAFNSSMAALFSRTRANKVLKRSFSTARLPLFIVKYASRQLVALLSLPLKQLLEIAFVFPEGFLRGFFDAEGHVDVCASRDFRVSAGVENSNRELLLRIRQVLSERFQIDSVIDKKRESGALKVIRGKPFQMRKSSFSLLILRIHGLRRFQEEIGFSISRKNQKLADALVISENYRWMERADRWRQTYSKLGGEWVKRRLPT
jgi:intein-encoded DNA endonuclease-like protein